MMMEPYRTAEVRWFGRGAVPADVRAWFEALGAPVEPESRTDLYLAPASDALGVKLRQGQVEAKRRDGIGDRLHAGRSRAPVEGWTKWSFPLAEAAETRGSGADAWIAVAKTRRQRLADGCALELSSLTAAGDAWWSVCLEATGPDTAARHAALADAARPWLGRPDAPALSEADAKGYPAWLRTVFATR